MAAKITDGWYSIGIVEVEKGFSCEFCLKRSIPVVLARKSVSQRALSICEDCCRTFLNLFKKDNER